MPKIRNKLAKNAINPLKLGKIVFKNNLILAPMAGVCLKPFRIAMKKMGAGLVCNEMVSSYGICYENKKTWRMLDVFDVKEKPVSVQVFGDKPEVIAEASTRLVDKGIEIIDINMGCPAPKVINGCAGSAILKDLDQVRQIVKKTRAAIDVPLTVKIRAGWDLQSVNAPLVAKVIEGEGADAVILHARTRSQKYKDFNWHWIKEVKDAIKIPVIGNGELFTPYDVERMFLETGCDGFMFGRSAETNPWIFKQVLDYFNSNKTDYFKVTDQEKLHYLLEFAHDFIKYRGTQGAFEVRKFIVWLTKGLPNSAELRKDLFAIKNLEDIEVIITKYQSFEG
ncbi:MAG: tRNA dihydrouridine synthase DusB [bacterium]|nr:tRNA dihydrouridine synthase DusB [bacterium]